MCGYASNSPGEPYCAQGAGKQGPITIRILEPVSKSPINQIRIIGCVLKPGDEQWVRIREHFPVEHIAPERPGRKPIPARKVLEAVLWILNTGAH